MKNAGDLINALFSDLQIDQGESYINFNSSWKKIAGEKIGNNSKIKDIVDGNLIIEIDHPGWKQLIQLKEKYIIKKIKYDFPELNVKKIKYYFKNREKAVDESGMVVNKDKKTVKDIEIDNSDFLSLLTKMNKRSEE